MQHRLSNLSTLAHQHRQIKRQQIDDLLALSAYLPRTDRVLIEQVLGGNLPIAQIAKLYQRPSRHLQRQASSIIKRLSNKMFKFVAIQMCTLPLEVRPTAKYVVLHGMSMRKTAQTSGLTLHRVRQNMNTVQATARLFV
jgi:hypothetical protein